MELQEPFNNAILAAMFEQFLVRFQIVLSEILGDVAALTRSSLICWEINTPNNKTMHPSLENNRAAWYQGPMKLEVVKSCGATGDFRCDFSVILFAILLRWKHNTCDASIKTRQNSLWVRSRQLRSRSQPISGALTAKSTCINGIICSICSCRISQGEIPLVFNRRLVEANVTNLTPFTLSPLHLLIHSLIHSFIYLLRNTE